MKFRVSESLVLTILLVYNSTQSSVVAFSPITLILSLLFALYLFIKNKKNIDKLFVNFSSLFFLVNIFLFFSLLKFDIFLSGYMYLKFLYAYLSIKNIGLDFFKNIVKIGYYGAIISLTFFFFQIINYDLTFKFVGFLQKSFDFLSFRNESFANNILFTVNSSAEFRNSGFMWEPKGFANFLIISIFFQLVIGSFKVFNKKMLIMLIALITTFSTTGFIALFSLLIFYFLNKNLKTSLIFFPIFILFSSIIFFNSDFLYDKIVYELSLTKEYENLLYQKKDYKDDVYSLGRTGSFIVDINDLKNRPFFGYGFTRENRTQSDFVKLIRVNGLSDLLAVYGIVGFILYFYMHHIFLKKMQNQLNFKFAPIILITLIIIYTASTLTSHPLWMSFLFLSLVYKKI
tara:strand:+ start:5021 stop:6223 length:1203 start_codon:yes stop_codon:yes gene_type:complete